MQKYTKEIKSILGKMYKITLKHTSSSLNHTKVLQNGQSRDFILPYFCHKMWLINHNIAQRKSNFRIL